MIEANPHQQTARLGSSLSGTNTSRAGDYNQRIVLQAIRVAGTTTSTELVEQTGLTQPTIGNITRRLLDRAYIAEAGRRSSGRGMPAQCFTINPDGGFGIGVNIDRDHVTILSLDLAGKVRTRATREIAFPMPDDVIEFATSEVRSILASGDIIPERLLGMGVALPGGLGTVALPHMPPGYDVWNGLDIAKLFGRVLPLPVQVDNDAAAAAIGEVHFGGGMIHRSFFYLLLTIGLGGGLVIDGSYHRGATGRAGRIAFLPREDGRVLQDTVSLSALYGRLKAEGIAIASPVDLATLGLRGLAVLDAWIETAAIELAGPLNAMNRLIDPGAVLIGGRLPAPLIDRLAAAVGARMTSDADGLWHRAPVFRAELAADAPAVGAAILAFMAAVLPSDTILMKTAGG